MDTSHSAATGLIAISTPIHKDLEISLRQLRNYTALFGEDFLYLMHLSREANHLRDEYNKAISDYPHAILIPDSKATSIFCTLGAHIASTEYLLKMALYPEYIYFHSSSDLLIRKGLSAHIRQTQSGIMHYRLSDGCQWMWLDRLRKDASLHKFLKELNIEMTDLCFGRIEGCYIMFDIWLEAYNALKNAYDLDEFISDSYATWPVEECAIPTHFVSKAGGHSSSIAIATKQVNGVESRNNAITLEDIHAYLQQQSIYGAKWFSQDSHDSAIQYLLAMGAA